MSEVLDAPETQTTDLATLPPADRAALVLNSTKTEADLNQLVKSLQAIIVVNSPAGRDQAHALAMTARSARTAIEKIGKTAREDATKFSKAVIAEEDRLIGIIQPEETRVLGLRNAWDKAEQDRKEAETKKERDRIAAHLAVIEQIKGYPALARDARTSAMAIQMLGKLNAIDVSGLEEFTQQAEAEKLHANQMIDGIIEDKVAQETEAARIKAEQEAEADRLAEQARIQSEQQAELLAQQARMKAQQEELDRRAAEMAQQAAELEARKAEAAKPTEVPSTVLAEDPRDALAQIMADVPKLVEPVLVKVPATLDEMHEIGEGIRNEPEPEGITPPAIAMIHELAFAYGVEISTATRWLVERADEIKALHESKQ